MVGEYPPLGSTLLEILDDSLNLPSMLKIREGDEHNVIIFFLLYALFMILSVQ